MTDVSKTKSLNTQLYDAVAAVAAAQDHLISATRDVARARHNETDAINRVNEAQKHFDSLVSEVKKSAPYNSGWRQTQ